MVLESNQNNAKADNSLQIWWFSCKLRTCTHTRLTRNVSVCTFACTKHCYTCLKQSQSHLKQCILTVHNVWTARWFPQQLLNNRIPRFAPAPRAFLCGDQAYYTNDTGEIVSHAGYHVGDDYGKYLNCIWTVEASAGMNVQLMPETFALQDAGAFG